ncbi:MAG: hypothetical protein Q4D62_12655 [Planctomycetia bacterium]|nr:hypothetical protein [Planctomycetia bacterium]
MEVLLKKDQDGIGNTYKKECSFCEMSESRRLARDRWLADVYKRTLLGEAEDCGIQKGLEIGLEKGFKKGLKKCLLTVLTNRFGEIPEELLRKLDSYGDDWEVLLKKGISCQTLEEFCEYWE